MKEYKSLLRKIKRKGVIKNPARENMPSTKSLFGAQFRVDLKSGFPLLTTKQLSFRKIVIELLWFLKGDTNIKYLVDNDCNIWNEDSYNYYLKLCKRDCIQPISFEEFNQGVRNNLEYSELPKDYTLGDCGTQYGALWRRWKTGKSIVIGHDGNHNNFADEIIDQFRELVEGLQKNPMSRRHIITTWNPATLNDMALNACHTLVQFNCRPLTDKERVDLVPSEVPVNTNWKESGLEEILTTYNIPKYYLDCQMYQRSADVFLGVPFNIASYALLTHIVAKMCNMEVGDFIHTFGDVHIYSNHNKQVNQQLKRKERELPELLFDGGFDNLIDDFRNNFITLDDFIECLKPDLFCVKNYKPHPKIQAKLSTGLK